jgi:hypothetical protein
MADIFVPVMNKVKERGDKRGGKMKEIRGRGQEEGNKRVDVRSKASSILCLICGSHDH